MRRRNRRSRTTIRRKNTIKNHKYYQEEMVEAVQEKNVVEVRHRKVTIHKEHEPKEATTVEVDVTEATIPILKAPKFLERRSRLDLRDLEHKEGTQVRGFLALFWIIITMYGVVSLYRNAGGGYLGMTLKLWKTSYADYEALLAMIGLTYFYTYIAIPYQWLVSRGWLGRSWNPVRVATRVLVEVTPIAMAIFVAKSRSWPQLQTGTFSLFTISMCMKIHAFLTTNGKLDRLYQAKTPEQRAIQKKNPQAYPNNLNFWRYTVYLWMPTYIYARSRG